MLDIFRTDQLRKKNSTTIAEQQGDSGSFIFKRLSLALSFNTFYEYSANRNPLCSYVTPPWVLLEVTPTILSRPWSARTSNFYSAPATLHLLWYHLPVRIPSCSRLPLNSWMSVKQCQVLWLAHVQKNDE